MPNYLDVVWEVFHLVIWAFWFITGGSLLLNVKSSRKDYKNGLVVGKENYYL
jgi:hypothetical protein